MPPVETTTKILVVEPDEDLATVLTGIAELAGYQVDLASSAFEMRQKLSDHACVIINYDGFNLKELELASEAAGRGAAVIIVPDMESDLEQCREAGCMMLEKPFRVADVRRVIEDALRARARRTANARN